MRRAVRAAAAAVLILTGPGLTGAPAAATQGGYGGHRVMQAAELAERIADKSAKRIGFFWVDLRNETDFKRSFIPGSINIPFPKLPFLAEKFFSKSDEVVFLGYPDSDHVSVNAVIFMKNKGFTDCAVLQGGIGAWTGDLETAAPGQMKKDKKQ